MYVPAWRVVQRASSSPRHLFVEVLLLAPVPPTFCPVRGNKVHANRSDELKSELHPDIPPKHTPANNWAADLVGAFGGSPSIRPLFILLHLYMVVYLYMHSAMPRCAPIDRPR